MIDVEEKKLCKEGNGGEGREGGKRIIIVISIPLIFHLHVLSSLSVSLFSLCEVEDRDKDREEDEEEEVVEWQVFLSSHVLYSFIFLLSFSFSLSGGGGGVIFFLPTSSFRSVCLLYFLCIFLLSFLRL